MKLKLKIIYKIFVFIYKYILIKYLLYIIQHDNYKKL